MNPSECSWAEFRNRAFDSRRKRSNLIGELPFRFAQLKDQAILARCDAVYFCAGDADALVAARRARVLSATARELGILRRGAVELDLLVGSGKDDAELYRPGDLEPEPKLVVTTSGALGGWAQPGGPFTAAPLPESPADAYGAGDCFAAGLTFALAAGLAAQDALAFAARCGAGALAGRGVHAEAVPL